MLRTTIDVRLTALQNKLDATIAGVRPTLAEATADAARQIEAIATEELQSEFNVSKSELSDRLLVDTSRNAISVKVSSRPISLSRFPSHESKRGVHVRIHKTRAPKHYRGAFLLGRRGVFRRLGRSRLPIRKLPGINLQNEKHAARAMLRAQRRAEIVVDQRTRALLEQRLYGALGAGERTPTFTGRILAEASDLLGAVTGGRRQRVVRRPSIRRRTTGRIRR